MAVARRVYLYAIAVSALGMLVVGLAGLFEVSIEAIVEGAAGPLTTVGGDLRNRVSYSGSLTVIGLVAWLIHWWLADFPVRRGSDVERRSAIRKLFLYGVLLVGGLALGLAGRELLVDLLELALGRVTRSNVVAGVVLQPLSVVVVVGGFWLYYTRVASLDRQALPEQGAGATLRRWYVYGLSFFGLLLLLFGATGLLETLWELLFPPLGSASAVGDGLATTVTDRIGSIGAGLVIWYLSWTWSTAWFTRQDGSDLESHSVLRKVYLYLVLAVVVAWTVWNVGQILYQLLEALLIPERLSSAGWAAVARDLGSAVAAALVFGIAWLYHAHIVHREAALAGERRRQATIRWIYGYLVALLGVVMFAFGLAGTGSTLVDLLVQPDAVRPTHWWEGQISLFATLIVVGLPIWLAYWGPLQRESSDALARRSLARRIYLFLTFGLAVLTLLGSGAFTLYQVIRLALGERWTAGQTSELIGAAGYAVVAALLLAYHLRVFRRDARDGEAAPALGEALGLVLVRSDSEARLEEFRRALKAQPMAGVEVQLLEVDAETAERIVAQVRNTGQAPEGRP